MRRRDFCLAAALTPAAFAQPTLPDAATANRLLTESPWAREVRVPFRQGFTAAGRSGSIATEVHLTVRWASALPVRQANAVLLGPETRAARKLLAAEPLDYVIDLAGLPASVVKDSKSFERELAASATLTTAGRRLTATSVHVPEFGAFLLAEIHFPRDPAFTLGDAQIEFTAAALAGAIKLRTKFVLKDMLYGGSLAL